MEFKMSMILLVLLYKLLLIRADGKETAYKLVLDKLEKEKEAEGIVKTDITFDKKDNEVLVNGQMELLVDIDDEYTLSVIIFFSDEVDGDYKKLMAMPKDGVCKYMQNFYKKYFYDSLKNYSNAPHPDNCPVTKDTYVIKDYPMDSSRLQKYLKPGFFRTEISLLNNDEEILKYKIYAHVQE